jgi:hypothetical protein
MQERKVGNMTLYEYRALSEIKQADAVWSGVFIGHRVMGAYRIALYNLGEFFVEVYYEVRNNEITMIKVIDRRSKVLSDLANCNIYGLN